MNDSERKLAESLIQTQKVAPEEMERCLENKKDGETLVDALVRQGTIQTGELERVLEDLPVFDEESDNTFARAIKKIGRYRVISEIGRGGMGRVYLAYDPNLKRSVALKVMRIEELEDAARYRRETEIAAGLQHPNIGAIFDAQQEDEIFIIAMQYIDGESLDKTRLDPREAMKAISEAARAVHYAHDHGIIHRDIKPENMMRTQEGRVFIMDFGVARRIERKASLTQTGTVIGTPMYMSPEQAAGRELDVRTDVYSLGATLYALIAGRPPFVGASVLDVIQRIGKSEPPKLQAFHPDLHGDVVTIIQKAMRKERIRRYQTALELAEDIERHLSGDPIEARPMSLLEKSVRHLRKRPWMVNALLFLTLAIGVGSGLIWRENLRDERMAREQKERREKQERSSLAAKRLEKAVDNIHEWDRFLLFEPRDLTLKRPLLLEAVSLCISARELAEDDPALADYYRARALALLGRHREAEAAVTLAIETAPEGRFYLERTRIRLHVVIRNMIGFGMFQALTLGQLLGKDPGRLLQDQQGGEYIRQILEDLEEAERLGYETGFEREYAGVIRVAFQGEFGKARILCREFLDRASTWKQAEIHRILALIGYLEFSSREGKPMDLLTEANKYVSLAIREQRSDADLYILRAQLGAGLMSHIMLGRSPEKVFSLKSKREEIYENTLRDVETALRIRPGDPDARILQVQLLPGKISLQDWRTLNRRKEDKETRVLLEKAVREVFQPGTEICALIVSDYPDKTMAWIQWTFLLVFQGVLEADSGRKPAEFVRDLHEKTAATAKRGLETAVLKRDRAILLFFRMLTFVGMLEIAADQGKREAVRKAALSDWEELVVLVPGVEESHEWLFSGLKSK